MYGQTNSWSLERANITYSQQDESEVRTKMVDEGFEREQGPEARTRTKGGSDIEQS